MLFAFILLLISSPLLVCCAFFILFDSGGDILFVQERMGKQGHVFNLYKFRTMTQDESVPFSLTQKNDTRITRMGRILRKSHLDELPQLINVLKGEMSLIGPRPVPMQLYETYLKSIPGYESRHSIRPGITGLAQVMQGYTNTLAEEKRKLEFDLHYIRNINLKNDFIIILKTLFG